MKAVIEITTNSAIKIIEKNHNDEKVLKDWLIKLSQNECPTFGYLENGTFAICSPLGCSQEEDKMQKDIAYLENIFNLR
jgi:hypothetical protein